MKKLLWSLVLVGCSGNPETPPDNPPEPITIQPTEQLYGWSLLLSKQAIAKELAIQQELAGNTSTDDPRLRLWAVEAVCSEIASYLEDMQEIERGMALTHIDQILVRGPLSLDGQLEELTKTGLIDRVCLIDGPDIEGPETQ